MRSINQILNQVYNNGYRFTDEQQEFIRDLIQEAYDTGTDDIVQKNLDFEYNNGFDEGYNAGKQDAERLHNVAVEVARRNILNKADKI